MARRPRSRDTLLKRKERRESSSMEISDVSSVLVCLLTEPAFCNA